MNKFFLDAGTTWSKILEIKNSDTRDTNPLIQDYLIKETSDRRYYILPSTLINKKQIEIKWTKTTGHMSGDITKKNSTHINEVIALAKGVKKINLQEKQVTVMDLGSRDVKWVNFENNKFRDLDWNSSCASATGATVEMLLKFYDVKSKDLKFNPQKYNITCGIFGFEKIMDDIAKGEEPKEAISKFIHGIAFNAWSFAHKPEKLYLSGGFCENEVFVKSLSNYCNVTPLGRFILTEGLVD